MAVVWSAQDVELGRTVAVKILRRRYASDPGFLARFRSEARAAARLNDPGVVAVYDVGEDAGRHYLVMEFAPGQDLQAIIRDGAPLPVGRAVEIGAKLARAVAAAHEEGLVHRDIKPQNVLVAADGRMKVADFGIARAVADAGLTEPGIVMGSAHYISPEQARGDAATLASDVYSLGVVVYEMLSGRVPHDAESTMGIASKILNVDPEPIESLNPKVPSVLAHIVQRAMARGVEQRYRNAAELADALEAFRKWSLQATGPLGAGETDVFPSAERVPLGVPTFAEGHAQPEGDSIQNAGSRDDLPAGRERGLVGRPGSSAADEGSRAAADNRILDVRGLALAVLALLAVAGLIPLWLAVIARAQSPAGGDEGSGGPRVGQGLPWWSRQAEAEPTPLSPTIAPPPTVAIVSVPEVVGRGREEAIGQLERIGLSASIELEESTPDLVGTVLAQVPAAGESAESGTVVKLSIGAPAQVLIPQPGADYAATEITLQGLGLAVQRRSAWTGAAGESGTVVAVDPPPGSRVPIGSPVIVTVASGSWTGLGVNFEGGIYLSGADLPTDTVAAGSTLVVTPAWEAVEDVGVTAGVRALLSDLSAFGPVLAEASGPLRSDRPSETWAMGEQIVGDTLVLTIDPSAAPGTYGLWLELLDLAADGAPLGIEGRGVNTIRDGRVLVRRVQVGGG